MTLNWGRNPPFNLIKMKITFKIQMGKSKGGYFHIPLLYIAFGKNGFSLCILCMSITIGWGSNPAKN